MAEERQEGRSLTDAEVEQYIQDHLPRYASAQRNLEALNEFAKAGFPGATTEQIVAIARNHQPERDAVFIRLRAENQLTKLLGVKRRRQPSMTANSLLRKGWR